jgi:hypothetical protein
LRDNAWVTESPKAPSRQADPSPAADPATINPEASSNVRVRAKRDWLYGPLLVATAVVGVTIATIAVIAFSRLASTGTARDWIPVYQDMLKTSFGALAVGALGGLAKLIFDQRKAREADANELRDRRYGFISTLVEVSHDIDTARTVIRANRSVKSWTDMVNDRIIPASCRLRDMTHELSNWAKAELRVFDDTESVAEELEAMNSYLRTLLDEYGDNKQALGELQLKVEEAKKTNQNEREQLLNQIWNKMHELLVLGDLIKVGGGSSYRAYRSNYVGALLKMRRSLVPKKAAQLTLTVGSAQGVTTPSSSDSQ